MPYEPKPFSSARTREGYHYTKKDGFEKGLVTEAAIEPKTNIKSSLGDERYDVVVVGAGYAGLIAARNLVTSGLKVLLLEARDRVGGRTWTSQVNGDKWEMGGTYVHYHQGHIWQEIIRYGLDKRILVTDSHDEPDKRIARGELNGKVSVSTYDETDAFGDSALHKIFNVDGAGGDSILPYVATPFDAEETNHDLLAKWDKLTLQDRIDELKAEGALSDEELLWVTGYIVASVGNIPATSGFLNMLRWYQQGSKSYPLGMKTLIMFKLKDGQSHLARNIFEDALATGNLDYAFDMEIQKLETNDDGVVVYAGDKRIRAKKAVCTIPLNVLKTIEFSPPVSDLRKEAFKEGHFNFSEKISGETTEQDHRYALGFTFDESKPYGLEMAYGDKRLNSGNIGVVAFGANSTHKDYVTPLKAPDDIPARFATIIPGIEKTWVRAVFSQWYDDPLAQGAWCNVGPGWHRYMKEVQSAHGNIHFASGDYADNWQGFMDGAMEEGFRKSMAIIREFKMQRKDAKL